MIKEITKQRFDALTFAVSPTAYIVFEEVGWFADENEHFLATVVYDKNDHDWGFIVLARNENHIFNCIDSGNSFKEALDAKAALFIKLAEYEIGDKQKHGRAREVANLGKRTNEKFQSPCTQLSA